MARGSVTVTWAPWSCIWAATLSAGESRMSSLSGLNAAPRTAMRRATIAPPQTPPAARAGRLPHPPPAPHVDRVARAQEGRGRVAPEPAGAGHERPDVLGQT